MLFAYTCAWFSFLFLTHHPLHVTLPWGGMKSPASVVAHVEWKWLFPPNETRGQTIKRKKKQRERGRDGWDHYLSCAAIIYTCGISNLAHFRHLTSQGSLASSSPWQSPATGSKTSFSSCRPSTTGKDCSRPVYLLSTTQASWKE